MNTRLQRMGRKMIDFQTRWFADNINLCDTKQFQAHDDLFNRRVPGYGRIDFEKQKCLLNLSIYSKKKLSARFVH